MLLELGEIDLRFEISSHLAGLPVSIFMAFKGEFT